MIVEETTSPTLRVGWDDLKAWLASQSAPTERVASVAFVPGGRGGLRLRVESFATDENGHIFAVRDESGQSVAARNVTWITPDSLP